MSIDEAYCGGPEYTEDVTGADHLYLIGAVSDGASTAGVVTRPIRINNKETVPFGEGGGIVFSAEVPDNRNLKVALAAFDEDAAKDWPRERQETLNEIVGAVSSGLLATGNPYGVGAGVVLPIATQVALGLISIDRDDELGTHVADFPGWLTPHGEHRREWLCRGGSNGWSNWRYRIRYRVIKG